jgi:hypothetical protein
MVCRKAFYSNMSDTIHERILLHRKLVLSGIAIFALLCVPLVPSVNAASMWSRTYGGAGGIDAFSLAALPDGGYVVIGSASTPDGSLYGTVDFWLFKIDALGNMEWNKTYGNLGTAYENGRTVIVTPDGGYLLCGFAATWYETWLYYVDSHSWVVKTDAYGNMEWNRTYGGQYAFSLVAASDGGYLVALDNMLVKTDAAGNMQWNKSYTGFLAAAADGGYAIAGGSALIKIDVLGNVEWNQTYLETTEFYAKALVATSDGGYAIAGETYSTTEPKKWVYGLVKTDASGNMQWNQTYDSGNSIDWPYSLVETLDGGYAIAGTTINTGDHYWLVKTDAPGNMQWSQTYTNGLVDSARAVVEASDGGYIVAGRCDGGNCWLVKTDETGVVPEYSSLLVPLLVLTATAFIIINKKRLLNKRS